MQAPSTGLIAPRLAAFVMGLLLAASSVYWVLHWPRESKVPPLALPALPQEQIEADPAALLRLLGASPASTDAAAAPVAAGASRYRLTGVIASASGQGVALLSVDGNPPKPYPVGSTVAEGLILQSVQQRQVALARDLRGPVQLRLELPPQQP